MEHDGVLSTKRRSDISLWLTLGSPDGWLSRHPMASSANHHELAPSGFGYIFFCLLTLKACVKIESPTNEKTTVSIEWHVMIWFYFCDIEFYDDCIRWPLSVLLLILCGLGTERVIHAQFFLNQAVKSDCIQ